MSEMPLPGYDHWKLKSSWDEEEERQERYDREEEERDREEEKADRLRDEMLLDGPEPDEYRYLGAGRWGHTTR